MRVPLSWLREFLSWAGSATDLADRLVLASLQVESIEEVGRLDGRIRVGRLVAVEPHPRSDQLRVCRVEAGGTGPLTVVSGAPGLAAGARVPVAVPGALLPGRDVVRARDILGVASEAVVCSEAELGLGDDAAEVLALPADAVPGTALVDLPGIADTVLSFEVTPNRGDCLSVLGVAREVAAVTRARLRRPRVRLGEAGRPAADEVSVRVDAADLCPRYCARLIRGATLRPSPLALRLRLRRAGMRPINALVDATNYVMLERGQPLHAFDLTRVRGGRIIVRRAAPAESFVTLDGVARTLEAGDLVIADVAGPVALAGVMGGQESEVTAATTTVLLESAWFDPETVRRTSRRLGLTSQAAYRFERRVDPGMVAEALDVTAALIVRLAGGRVARGMVEAAPGASRLRSPAVRLRVRRVQELLGARIARGEIERRVRALGARCRAEQETLWVTPPSYRGDLAGEEDLVEEVARLGGYDAIPLVLPEAPIVGGEDGPGRRFARRVRGLLVAEGLVEMVTLSFTDADTNRRLPGVAGHDLGPLAVRNPLSSETGELRRSPLSGLLRALARNLGLGAAFVGAFEIGRAYGLDPAGQCAERRALAVVLHGTWPAAGPERSGPATDFLDLKGILANLLLGLGVEAERIRWQAEATVPFLHPGKAASVAVDGTAVGALGALHPEVAQAADLTGEVWVAELDLERLAHYVPRRVALRPVPRFPAVTRDLAVVVDEPFLAGEIVEEVLALRSPHIESIRLFDCYRGAPVPAGRKSLAYTIAYRAADRTLTDEEVQALHGALLERLSARFELTVRT